jgi:LPXTG-motif cell wall-anchored protein
MRVSQFSILIGLAGGLVMTTPTLAPTASAGPRPADTPAPTGDIYLDKIVDGGNLTFSDFPFSVYPVTLDWEDVDTSGSQWAIDASDFTVASTPIATGTDPQKDTHMNGASNAFKATVPDPSPPGADFFTPYLIQETTQPGYSTLGWQQSSPNGCDPIKIIGGGFGPQSAIVSVRAGETVACTISNTVQPPDLAVTKTVESSTAVAGLTATYDITVTNVGGMIVLPPQQEGFGHPHDHSPVYVSDQLPSGMTWIDPIPEGCEVGINPGLLHCTFSSELVNLPASTYPIRATASIAPDVSTAHYVNQVDLDYPGVDPRCADPITAIDGVPCHPPVCNEVADATPYFSNAFDNVACVDLDVSRLSTIGVTMTDDSGGAVHPGATFHYRIVVNNSGPSTLLNLELSDDFPDYLHVDMVDAGDIWNCSQADPLLCTMPVSYPGDAPPIVVTVTLDPSFEGAEIPNTATASAVWDVEPPSLPAVRAASPTVASGRFATVATAASTITVLRAEPTTTASPTTAATTTAVPVTAIGAPSTTAAPVAPPTTMPEAIELPSTGTNSSTTLVVAIVVLVIGAGLVFLATRRRRPTPGT